MRYDTLELRRAVQRELNHREHREYIVNDRPLSHLLPPHGKLSAFGWLSANAEKDFARMLLLKTPHPLTSGRAALYVCSQCADLGCGALTVGVTRYDDRYMWKDFGFENQLGADTLATCADGYEFHFERAAYESVFQPLT
jgi:hypothetical protein